MNTRILLFLLIGGLLAVRTQETHSDGSHHHHQLDQKDDIFIDDVTQADPIEGSAGVSDTDDEASGFGPDDEDTVEGSGDFSGRGRGLGIELETPVSPITPASPKKSETNSSPSTPEKESAPVTTPTTTTSTTTTTTTTSTTTTTTSTTQTPKRPDTEVVRQEADVNAAPEERSTSFFSQPGILAAIIGGAVVGLLCAILLVMFIVYRMRKKDEGSYVLDEPRRSPRNASYHPANKDSKEFFA